MVLGVLGVRRYVGGSHKQGYEMASFLPVTPLHPLSSQVDGDGIIMLRDHPATGARLGHNATHLPTSVEEL